MHDRLHKICRVGIRQQLLPHCLRFCLEVFFILTQYIGSVDQTFCSTPLYVNWMVGLKDIDQCEWAFYKQQIGLM
jgi:hypothetical protein